MGAMRAQTRRREVLSQIAPDSRGAPALSGIGREASTRQFSRRVEQGGRSVSSRLSVRSALAALAVAALGAALAAPAPAQEALVTVGSPPVGPFSQNKQNEPAVAVDPSD